MSRQGENLASVTPDQKYTPRKKKRKKTPSSLVLRKEPIGDTVNQRKILQEDNVIDPEKGSQHKTSRPYQNKKYYEGDTDGNNCYTDDSRTGNDYCAGKLDTEQENKDDKESQEYEYMVSITNELKLSESKNN